MKSIADQLPPEIAKQIHPEWRKNEADYWAVRDELLAKFKDQWIGFPDGKVVASGTIPIQVSHAASAMSRHAFVTCVGHEHEPIRIRRASFRFDTSYSGEPLPVLDIEFRLTSGSIGTILDRVIADTGADVRVGGGMPQPAEWRSARARACVVSRLNSQPQPVFSERPCPATSHQAVWPLPLIAFGMRRSEHSLSSLLGSLSAV